jgi:hypothetical protein
MNRSIAISACITASLLAACDARERSMAERERAGKASQAVAAARDVAALVSPSPEAVATTKADGESTAEIAKPVLAPGAGAEALEAAAAKVSSSAAGAGTRESAAAQALAARLRMEALAIRLAEAERIGALAASVAGEAVDARRLADSLAAKATPGELPKHAAAARDAARAHDAERQRIQEPASAAKTELEALEARISEDDGAAEKLDAEILALRGEAAVAPADRALPLMLEAREKLEEAQTRRRQANAAEMEAEKHRSEVRVAQGTLAGDDAAGAYLSGRAESLAKASEALGTVAEAAAAATKDLRQFAAGRDEAFRRILSEEFGPASQAVEKGLDSGTAAKDPIDVARMAILRARFAALQASVARAEASIAGEGASSAAEARINGLMEKAKAALVEAREALAGVDAERGGAMLASATGMASALGIDLSSPAAPLAAPEGGDAQGGEPAAGDPAAGDPASDAPADPPAEEPTPADAPAEPTEPPAGEPAPGDVPPEDQPKA